MANSNPPIYKAAVVIFPGADVLDFTCPIEVFNHAFHNGDRATPAFTIETIARESLLPYVTTESEHIVVRPTRTIRRAIADINSIDVLVVPGANLRTAQTIATSSGQWEGKDPEEVNLIKAFAGAGAGPNLGREPGKEKILLSVCSGSLLLAVAGCLDGIEATSHHSALDMLSEMGGGKAKVVSGKRFVDAGSVKPGFRIVTSGGVTSGLEGSLHVVKQLTDDKATAFASEIIEFETREGWGSQS